MDYSFHGGDTSQRLTGSVPRVQLPRLREVIFSFAILLFSVLPPMHPLVFSCPWQVCLISHTRKIIWKNNYFQMHFRLLHLVQIRSQAVLKKHFSTTPKWGVQFISKGTYITSAVCWIGSHCTHVFITLSKESEALDVAKLLLFFGQISSCLLLTLHLWLICLCNWSEICWQRTFSTDWWLWEICGCNPPKLYWYVHTAIPLYRPDQRCQAAKIFFL